MRTAVAALLLAVLLVALFAGPAGAQWRTHLVRPGENLYRIALHYGVTVAGLMEVNGLRSDRIRAGQVLRIPSPRTAPDVQSPPAREAAVSATPLEVGSALAASRPIRLRRGPRSYHTTLAIAAEGALLEVVSVDGSWLEVSLADGTVGWVLARDLRRGDAPVGRSAVPEGPAVRGADLAREALRYLGIPYLWGGESPRGVDCSGFVYVVFSARLPHLARLRSFDYYRMGLPVERADLQPGDLVFFSTYAPGPSHVGIYAGSGRFLHASSGARRVLVTPLDDPYYATRYVGARRLVAP
jgi:cell wall-associated NlpC family hydrolase